MKPLLLWTKLSSPFLWLAVLLALLVVFWNECFLSVSLYSFLFGYLHSMKITLISACVKSMVIAKLQREIAELKSRRGSSSPRRSASPVRIPKVPEEASPQLRSKGGIRWFEQISFYLTCWLQMRELIRIHLVTLKAFLSCVQVIGLVQKIWW